MRPLSWWFPGHIGAALGTAGLTLLAHALARPQSGAETEINPAIGVLVGAAALGLVALLTVAFGRLRRERPTVTGEFFDPARGGFFFLTPLCLCIVGLAARTYFPATETMVRVVWLAAALLWAVLTPSWFLGLALRAKTPLTWPQVTPGWLLPGASLQGLLLLGLALEPATGRSVLALGAFLFASLLLVVGVLVIATRWLLGPIDPAVFGPSQWINLGALAICSLTAAQFGASAPPRFGIVFDLLSILFWTLAAVWAPLLVAVGIWRHRARAVPFAYTPENWALVFSPSVFGVATLQLGNMGADDWTAVVAFGAFAFAALAWAVNLAMWMRGR